MPKQPTELRGINWSECFPFTHLFRTFKLVVHPNKLVLALAAVLLTGLWGWFLDAIWSDKHQALNGEVNASWQVPTLDEWRQSTLSSQARQIRMACTSVGVALAADFEERFCDHPAEASGRVLKDIRDAHEKALESLQDTHRERDKSGDDKSKDEDARQAAEIANLAGKYGFAYQEVREASPRGVFRSFAAFECGVVQQLFAAARGLNLTGGLHDVLAGRMSASGGDASAMARALVRAGRADAAGILAPARSGPDGLGVLSCVVLGLRGKQWLVTQHFWFFLLFSLPVLVVWALAGGAICRIAALNVAREEQISIKAALAFALQKLVGLFAAPLFPGLAVAGLGALMIIGGAIVAVVPYAGEIIWGLLLGLALPGGFIMAAILIGAVAGSSLMWPTIAVEGSDSFDAMSRSYSYVYARPWRTIFYGGVALVYGAICYFFARFFVLVALRSLRFFFGLGMIFTPRPGTGNVDATKIDTLWPAPTFEHLRGVSMPFGMEGAEAVGAFLVCLWVTLAISLLYAFVASFYLSGSTVIYYLLRQVVDGTDYEDVYTEEEEEEEFAEQPAGPTSPEATSAAAAPASPAPAPAEPAAPPPPAPTSEPNTPPDQDADASPEEKP